MAHRGTWPLILTLLAVLSPFDLTAEVAPEDPNTFSGIIIATPWEVRREAAELMEDLVQRRGALPRLLDRTQDLLARHGRAAIRAQDDWVPMSEVLTAHLKKLGLLRNFIEVYQHPARNELNRLLEASATTNDDLIDLARRYPGTPAARESWSRLADIAWDRGRLGAFLHFVERSGPLNEGRQLQVTAARELLVNGSRVDLPNALKALGRMWAIDGLPNAQRQERETLTFNSRRNQDDSQPIDLFFSEMNQDTVAVSDGTIAFVFDPLFGDRLGDIHQLVPSPTPGNHHQPVHDGQGYLIAALQRGGRPVIVALGYDGQQRWRTTLPLANTSSISQPVLLDGKIIISCSVPTGAGTELRLVALNTTDGSELWNILVAKDPRGIHHHWRVRHAGFSLAPSCTIHNGTVVVCSHTGLLAQVGSDGSIHRAWTYGSANPVAPQLTTYASNRRGSVLSDGNILVAAPSDSGVLLIMGPNDDRPVVYDGPGARDTLLDVAHGQALLASSRMTLLDLTKREAEWHVQAGKLGNSLWGRIGQDRVLILHDVHGQNTRALHLGQRSDGSLIDGRELANDTMVGIAGDLVMSAGKDESTNGQTRILIGYGDERGFQRLQERVVSEPNNPRPLVGLASLYRAREDFAAAYDHIVRAIEITPSPNLVDQAARFARHLVDLSVGSDAFPVSIARFDRLAAFDPAMELEATWWQGRHAEIQRDPIAASAAFQEVLGADPSIMVSSEDGLGVQLRLLAQLGLARTAQHTIPTWLTSNLDSAPPLNPQTTSWQLDDAFFASPLFEDDLVIGYTNGRLTAMRADNGKIVWQRNAPDGEPPFLGVRMLGNGPQGGVLIDTIPGSAAHGAGLRNKDSITSFNGITITNNRQLAETIAAAMKRPEFTIEVQRNGENIILKGKLGTQLLHPTAINDGMVLIQRHTVIEGEQNNVRVVVDRIRDPISEIRDLETGTLLWRIDEHGVWPESGGPPPPHLLGNDLVMVPGDDAMHVIDITNPNNVLWSLPGLSDVKALEVLSGGPLLISNTSSMHSSVRHHRDGSQLLSLPVPKGVPVLLAEQDAFGILANGHLACWHLGIGRRRWTREVTGLQPLAAVGDALYVLDDSRQLVIIDRPSGETRRNYVNWPTIHETAITKDTLFVYASDRDGVPAIAAVSLIGGTISWQSYLPGDLELRGPLIPVGDGVGCVLAGDGLPPGLMVLNDQGNPVLVRQIQDNEQVSATPVGLIGTSPTGVRSFPPGLPDLGSPIQIPIVDVEDDLAATADAAMNVGAWRTVGNTSYLIAKSGNNLLVLMRVTQQSQGLTIHLADSGGDNSDGPLRLHLRPGHSPIPEGHNSAWRLSGVRRILHQQPQWSVVVRLSPSLTRRPGSDVVIRAAADGEVDGPEAPWWLRRSWRTLRWDP